MLAMHFANEHYFRAVYSLFLLEESVTGNLRFVCDTQCTNMVGFLLMANLTNIERIYAMASWEFPISHICTEGKFALESGLEILKKIQAKEILPKRCDGLMAKSIQRFMLHMDYSYRDFVELK